MSVYFPCLNVDSGNSQSGSGIQLVTPNSIASGLVSLAGQAIPVTIGETVLYLNPFTAIASFFINWNFWSDLFGLGETRIDREKATIQAVMTPLFQYLSVTYGVPIADFHALDFPSDGVQQQFTHRPEIAALAPAMYAQAGPVCNFVFASADCSEGQLERIVNQFLANAAYNGWPASATTAIWQGLLDSANPQCSADPNRWLKNPQIAHWAAVGAALLQYIPLRTLADMSVGAYIDSPLLQNLFKLWATYPELVTLPPATQQFDWQQPYFTGSWLYADSPTPGIVLVPLEQRAHIVPIINTVQVPLARYPDFGVATAPPTPPPVVPLPPVTPPTQSPTPTPPPQTSGPQGPQPTPPPPTQTPTTEIPPAPQQPTYTPAQLDFACTVSKKLYAGQPLTDTETAWYNDLNNIPLLNLQLNNPACKAAPTQSTTPPPPAPQAPPPSQSTPQWTQAELDYACHISRLLYGNAPLTSDEQNWYNDPKNNAILNYQLNNPNCKTPLTRETPSSPAVPTEVQCPPTVPGQSPQGPTGPGPVTEIPTSPPSQGQSPSPQPCPPDCIAMIQEVDGKRQECCDELHQNILPRIIDLEHWVEDIERRVPGPEPELPVPYPIPPVGVVPGTDIPPTIPDEPTPPPPPVTLQPTPENCNVILQCLIDHCPEVVAILKACTPKDLTTDCEEGIAKWGKWAECWFNANTATPTVQQGFYEQLIKSGQYGARFKALVSGQSPGLMAQVQQAANDRYKRALAGDYSQLGKPPFPYIDGVGYIFENVSAPNVLEIPPVNP